jgi:hypothetical protein
MERMGLAGALLSQLEPGVEPTTGVWGEIGELERLAGVPAGSLDADTALRAAQFMDVGFTPATDLAPARKGLNLGAREAVAIAIGERLSEPRENKSRFQRAGRLNEAPMGRAFYELGLGKALERAGDLVPAGTAVGEGLTVDGVEYGPDEAAVQGVRGKVRALDDQELRLARQVYGHGRKVGTSGKRNALAKESFGERVVGGDVPLLMARRTEQERWDGPNKPPKLVMEVPTVQQPKEQRWVQEERARLQRDAAYAGSPMERARAGQLLKQMEAIKDESAYELNEGGKSKRVLAVDPRGVRQLLVDPSVVLDPMELGLADDHPLIALAKRYSQVEPVKGKFEVGAYEAVGAPNPEAWNVDEFGRAHGFSVPNDPGVPREAVWPTVGQTIERALQEAETPVRTLVMGRRPVEPDFGTVQQYWNEVDVKPTVADYGGQLVIVQERDGRPVPGPAVFAVDQWAPEQGEGDEVFTRRYRVGENAKWRQEKLEGAREVVRALADYAGAPGDWRLVGDSGLSDPLMNAVQNTALQRTLGADSVSSRNTAVRGEFPDRVERVGRVERGTVYDNPLFTVLDTIARLGGRPADDAPVRAPAMGPGSQEYGETWHGVVKPLLEQNLDRLRKRLDAAPGMWRFDDFKSGGIYGGVPALPPVAVPTMESVMGSYTANQNAGLPAGLALQQVLEGMRVPGRLDADTAAVLQGWLAENVQSPTRTRGVEVGDYSAGRPYEPVLDLGAELAANALTGPGRYGDEVPLVAVPAYGELVQQAQAQAGRWRDPAAGVWEGVTPYWGVKGELAPPQWTDPAPEQAQPTRNLLLGRILENAKEQMAAEAAASFAAIGEGVGPAQIAQAPQLPPGTVRQGEVGMGEMEWRPQERRPAGEYIPDPRASWLARRM